MEIFELVIDEMYESPDQDGTWLANVQVNDMLEVFTLKIKNGKTETEIDYITSPYSDEKITEIWKEVQKTDKLKKSISIALEMTNELERIKKMNVLETIPITLISYEYNNGYDIYEFRINGGNLHFYYGIRENDRHDQYTHAIYQSHETDSIMVEYIYSSFSDELNEKIIDTLENHPKVKLKRLFKNHA